jgi:Rod binding domain-containing protein
MTDSFLNLNAMLPLNEMSSLEASKDSQSLSDLKDKTIEDPELRQAAEDFEAAFISQMLKFSGLGEALTKGGGEDVAAFTDFYIENYAEKIVDKGGFGLADRFYEKLAAKSEQAKESLLDVRS